MPDRVCRSAAVLGVVSGRNLGESLTERLEIDVAGVIYVGADGARLFYPHPETDAPVLPTEGARWPLRRAPDGGNTLTRTDNGQTLLFPRSTAAGRWPLGELRDRAETRITFGHSSDGALAEIVHDGGYHVRVSTQDGRVTALHAVGAGPDGTDVELIRYGSY